MARTDGETDHLHLEHLVHKAFVDVSLIDACGLSNWNGRIDYSFDFHQLYLEHLMFKAFVDVDKVFHIICTTNNKSDSNNTTCSIPGTIILHAFLDLPNI